jgi:hypothetical protein
MFHLRQILSRRRSMKNPTSSVECGTSWLEKADVERRASFDRGGTSAAEGFAWPGGQAAYRSP